MAKLRYDLEEATYRLRAEIMRGPQAAWTDTIMARAMPSISIALARVEQPTHGGSFVSGVPTLPSGMIWPVGRDGTPLGFVAQIDLAEVPELDKSPLPTEGFVYFFAGRDEPASNVDHQVIYLPVKAAETHSRQAPAGAILPSGLLDARPCALTMTAHIAMHAEINPPASHPDPDGFLDEVFRIYNAGPYKPGESNLFGPSADFEDRSFEAALTLAGFGEFLYDTHLSLDEYDNSVAAMFGELDIEPANRRLAARDRFIEMLERRPEIESAKTDWLKLFEFGSHQVEGREFYSCWWDAGSLQFWANRSDLLARDFSKTYCCIYSS